METNAPIMTAVQLATERGSTPRTRGSVSAQWYEGSRWSPNRSFIWFPVQSAKKDLDRYTRGELNKAAEALWKNSPLIRGIIKRIVTLIIGRGAIPTPKSSSPEFNAELKTFLRNKFRQPCVDNRKSFANYQRKKMTGMMKHGESFTVFVTDPVTKQDRIQGFEWFRCCADGGQKAPEKTSENFATERAASGGDGIECYETGMPKAYRFTGMEAPVPADLVVHHSIVERDEQVRGETILAAALNTARDVKDILDLEKMAVKDASSKQDIIQTMSGEYDPEAMHKLAFGGTSSPGPMPPEDDTAKTNYYNNKFQGGAVLLKTGDKYTPYIPNRPGNAWEGFMAFLANMIVLSTGLPPSVVLPIDIGGTDIRRDIQLAQRLVEIYQDEFDDDLQVIAEWFIKGGIEDRAFKSRIPADWNNLIWHFPGSLTVDRNRDADRREAVGQGLLSYDEFFGEGGYDGDEQEQKIVAEVKRRRFRIIGTPIDQPFKDADEFKQFLDMGTLAKIPDFPEGGEPAPGNRREFQNA